MAARTGRKPGNISRTLKTLSRYGLIDLHQEKRHLRPIALSTDFQIMTSA
ncbi:MAG TPA: hypothetical protein VN617_04230 [Rhodoferax sp.]|nr:hypothetical protein [Rhodoferax sp.]